jgi:hypothetical protein
MVPSSDPRAWSYNPRPDTCSGSPRRHTELIVLAHIHAMPFIECMPSHPLHKVYAEDAYLDRAHGGGWRRWDRAKMPKASGQRRLSREKFAPGAIKEFKALVLAEREYTACNGLFKCKRYAA